MNKKIVIAGASGYLGNYLVQSFSEAGYDVTVLVRSIKKIDHIKDQITRIHVVDISDPKAIEGLMEGADAVISSVGITRQKDGLTYMDVDYQCNINLLEEALTSKVKKFMYISALNGEHLTKLKIMKAKEQFVEALLQAPIEGYVIRPSGFFSDIAEVYHMAKSGRVYLFGNGGYKSNPIHGSDLANYCVETITLDAGSYEVGGPEILTQIDLANKAFEALGQKAKISKIPKFIADIIKAILRLVTKVSYYGPIEFFMTVLTMDMVAPTYGHHQVGDFFKSLE